MDIFSLVKYLKWRPRKKGVCPAHEDWKIFNSLTLYKVYWIEFSNFKNWYRFVERIQGKEGGGKGR